MYKVMTKLHTTRENVFAFHMVTNDKGETVEYSVTTLEEAADKALELLERIGYADLRIADDQSYYLDLVYGTKPIPEPNLYVLSYENIEGYAPDVERIENIEEGTTVSSLITFGGAVDSFHLIVDGKEYKTGNPAWITFKEISETEVKITYSGITRDHTVEIVIDKGLIITPEINPDPDVDSI